MATGHKETKTPMELATTKGRAKALTVLGQYTQVKIFGVLFVCLFLCFCICTLMETAATKSNAKALIALEQYVKCKLK